MTSGPGGSGVRRAGADPVKVVYIAGYGRSGSTLLDRLLGEQEGWVSTGQIRRIWTEGFQQDLPCGCGRSFSACPFWSAVAERAYGPGGPDGAEVLRLKRRVDRQRYVPLLLPASSRRLLRSRLDPLGEHLVPLYRAARDVAGARVVVDSSKKTCYAYVLRALPELDLRVVHLVRDSRATAHSWQRSKYDPGKRREMYRLSARRVGIGWTLRNLALLGMAGTADRYLRLRYDDMVADPAGALAAIAELAGEAPDLRHVRGLTARLGKGHLLAANPLRFDTGPVAIREDRAWRSAMPARRKLAVTALSWPGLVGFGYPLDWRRALRSGRSAGGSGGSRTARGPPPAPDDPPTRHGAA